MTKQSKLILIVILLNLSYFFVEFFWASAIHSVSLFSDSIDFLEDSLTSLIALIALGWSLQKRQLISLFLALLLMVPSIATLVMIYYQLQDPIIPESFALGIVAGGAFIINCICSLILIPFRRSKNSLLLATYLSARNDCFSNALMIAAAVITLYFPSFWPDLLVGALLFIINFHSAAGIIQSSLKERKITKR